MKIQPSMFFKIYSGLDKACWSCKFTLSSTTRDDIHPLTVVLQLFKNLLMIIAFCTCDCQ